MFINRNNICTLSRHEFMDEFCKDPSSILYYGRGNEYPVLGIDPERIHDLDYIESKIFESKERTEFSYIVDDNIIYYVSPRELMARTFNPRELEVYIIMREKSDFDWTGYNRLVKENTKHDVFIFYLYNHKAQRGSARKALYFLLNEAFKRGFITIESVVGLEANGGTRNLTKLVQMYQKMGFTIAGYEDFYGKGERVFKQIMDGNPVKSCMGVLMYQPYSCMRESLEKSV